MSAIPPGAVTSGLDLTAFARGGYVGPRLGGAVGRRFDSGVTRKIDWDGAQLDAEVTVEEDHEDALTITEHPVEYGAAITDHAYRRPSELRLRVGWSDAYVGGPARIIYEQVLALQRSRRPFSITTGKRQYTNMLISELRTQTNSGLEYTFLADISFREILLVSTQTIKGIPQQEADLSNVEKNGPTITTGLKPPISASMTGTQVTNYGGDLNSALTAPSSSIDLGTSIAPPFDINKPPDLGAPPT